MKCEQCGLENKGNSAFCSKCGAAVKKNNTPFTIGGFSVLAFIGLIAFKMILFNHDKIEKELLGNKNEQPVNIQAMADKDKPIVTQQTNTVNKYNPRAPDYLALPPMKYNYRGVEYTDFQQYTDAVNADRKLDQLQMDASDADSKIRRLKSQVDDLESKLNNR
jgi:peptidoglycan hydrolase CwlO-like protein